MRANIYFFFAVAIFVAELSTDTLAQCWITPSSDTMCAGQTYGFSTDSDGSIFTWYLNGTPVPGYTSSFAYITFPNTSGNQSYQVSVAVSGNNGGGGDGGDGGGRGGIQLQAARFFSDYCTPPAINVNVSGSYSPWQATASTSVLNGSGDVTLSTNTAVPADQRQYLSWRSDPIGYSGSGPTFTATGINTSTTFYLDYNGPNCYSRSQVSVSVLPPLCPITTNASAFCTGKGYSFSTSAGSSGNYTYRWYVNNTLVTNVGAGFNTGSSAFITFASAGTSTISVYLDEVTGGGGGNEQIFSSGIQRSSINTNSGIGCTPQDITVTVSNTTPLTLQASPTSVVGPGTVTLSTPAAASIPANQQQYLTWTSSTGSAKTGASVDYFINSTTTFNLSYSGTGCFSPGQGVTVTYSDPPQCTITPSSATMCAGQTYGFSTDSQGSVFTWYLNGSPVPGNTGSFAYITFPYSSGNQSYQVSVTVSGDNGGGGGGGDGGGRGGIQLQAARVGSYYCTPPAINVSVSGSYSPWQATASTSVLYGSGDVTLSTNTAVPADQRQYLSWRSDPIGYSGSGATFTATGINTSTTFYLDYNGPNCYSRSQVSVSVLPPLCPITTNASAFCTGKGYSFSTSAGSSGNYTYQWYVNNTLVTNVGTGFNTGSSAFITFASAGNSTIRVEVDEVTDGGGDGGIRGSGIQRSSINTNSGIGCTPQDITVTVSNTTPLTLQASPTSVVGPGTVTLSTPAAASIPANQQQYLTWTSSTGSAKTGASVDYLINSTTTFNLSYTGTGCFSPGQGVTVTYSDPPCSIETDANSFCVGREYTFYSNQDGGSFAWFLDGAPVGNNYSDLTLTFSTGGLHDLEVAFYPNGVGDDRGGGGGGGDGANRITGQSQVTTASRSQWCRVTRSITVGVLSPALDLSASANALCDGGSVLLSAPTLGTVPDHIKQQYRWSSVPPDSRFNGTGASLQANGLTQTTKFILENANICMLPAEKTIEVHKTNVIPLRVTNGDYRNSKIIVQAQGIDFQRHYWQIAPNASSLNGTATDMPLLSAVEPYSANASGYYYIRSYLPPAITGTTGCWTSPSNVVQVQVGVAPPLAKISQIKRFGYNELYLTNDDAERIQQLATYHFVTAGGSALSTFLDKSSIYEEKTVFIRGIDNASQTWGPILPVTILLRGDNDLNWIHTKSYDGLGSSETNILSESKSFFDQRGQSLQSQTKTFHNNLPVVFASQSLKDKYDRTVGGTLSAPILENDFRYKAAFALNDVGKPLSYVDFDKTVPLSTDQKGTLGNYYSAQNQWNEKDVPNAKRLFSRTDFYEDGTGEERKSAQPGDTHFIGSGREVLKGTFPVGNSDASGEDNELTDYLNKRAIIFGGSALKKIEGVQTVVRDENERFVVSVTDKSGKVLMTARKGTRSFPSSVSSDKMAYFYVLGAPNTTTQSVTINGTSDYVLENTISNTTVPKLTSPLPHTYNLQAGYYRVLPTSGTVKVSYTNYFSDIAYQFYNDAGRLVVSISPNGYEQWVSGTPYADIDKSTHTYNHQGWMLSMTEKDAGTTNYLYRRDGKIRFSQNAEQLLTKKYSYTNYDDLGRPIESGESSYQTANFNDLKVNLEAIGSNWMGQSPVKKDWVQTGYDFPVSAPNFSPIPGFAQTYVRGAVSYTKNANTKTWYSYDELGRVVWMAQQPTIFPYAFVTQYVYDFLGNVLTTSTKAYSGSTSRDAFFHHYEYDKNKRLVKVYTSLDGNKKTLQAEYFYYLHGPLKRVVLATNLQGIDFVYNIHGWLTQINHPDTNMDPGNDGGSGSSVRKDVFGMILEYYERTMIPTTASLDPNQFHKIKIPNAQDAATVQTAVLMDPIELYRASMRHGIEGLRDMNRSAVTSGGSGGGQ